MSENKYTRKQNENFLQYADRLIKGRKSGEYDLDKSEIYELLTGESCGTDHARKTLCFLEKILDKVEVDNINLSENELLEKLQEEKREIYKAKQKLRDEKNEYNSWLREQSRIELFYERFDESIEKLIARKRKLTPTVKETIREKDVIGNNTSELLVSFGDVHYDAEFIVEGLKGDVLNEYSREIAEKRLWKLRDEIVDFADLHNIKVLHISDCGDVLENILRIASFKSVKNNIMDSIVDYMEFIDIWLESLAREGFVVNFYTSMGNHSQIRLLNGEYRENLECLYNRLLRKLYEDRIDVVVHNNIRGINYFNVQGFDILTVHGQDEKNIASSIKEYEDTYDVKIDYMITAHKHTKKELETTRGKEVIQIRSIMGGNDYSTTLKKISDAGATMFTIHKGVGRKYTNDVKF